MAFGISKQQVKEWKNTINRGEIAFLTHFWLDERFPNTKSVTKVGCNDLNRLAEWGEKYQLKKEKYKKKQKKSFKEKAKERS